MADGIARTLRIKILSGEFPPGERLPTEQALADTFGVNRATLREAIKQLEMLGLVAVQQRTGIRVREFWNDSGLELLRFLVETAVATDRLDLQLLESLLEVRRFFYGEVARVSTARASEEMREAIAACVDVVLAAETPEDFLSADLALVETMAHSSQNLVVRLLFNSFSGLYREHFGLFTNFYLDAVETRKPFYAEIRRLVLARDVSGVARHVRDGFEAEDGRILALARAAVQLIEG
jgi:fatty acid metabolism transcriptional regulator FadR